MADGTDTQPHTIQRERSGQFSPGCSGNPKGRPVGALGHATLLKRALTTADDPLKAAETIVVKAVVGNVACAKFLVDRLDPRPTGRPVMLQFPDGPGVADRMRCVFETACAGQITPAEANLLSQLLEREGRARRAEAAAEIQAAKTGPSTPAPSQTGGVPPVSEPPVNREIHHNGPLRAVWEPDRIEPRRQRDDYALPYPPDGDGDSDGQDRNHSPSRCCRAACDGATAIAIAIDNGSPAG
jgi:hypothetical protein